VISVIWPPFRGYHKGLLRHAVLDYLNFNLHLLTSLPLLGGILLLASAVDAYRGQGLGRGFLLSFEAVMIPVYLVCLSGMFKDVNTVRVTFWPPLQVI
jgi:hypothetical protein